MFIHVLQNNHLSKQNSNTAYQAKQPKQAALLLRRHPHIRINRRTERRKTNTTSSRSLRARLRTKDPARDATSRDTVGEVVLRAQALNAALRASVERTDDTEIFGRGPGAGAHVFEAAAELFAPGEVGEGGSLRGECGVVGHTSHEQAEGTTQRKSHCTGDGGLDGTGFHCCVHRLDHCLLLVTHALHIIRSSHTADGRSHSWKTHVGF